MQYALRVLHTLPIRRFLALGTLGIPTRRSITPHIRLPPRLLCTMADHEPKPRAEPGHPPAADGKTVHEKAKKNKKEKKHEGSSSLEVCSSNLSYRDRELMVQLAPPPEFIDHRIQIFEKHWTKYQAELASSCPQCENLLTKRQTTRRYHRHLSRWKNPNSQIVRDLADADRRWHLQVPGE